MNSDEEVLDDNSNYSEAQSSKSKLPSKPKMHIDLWSRSYLRGAPQGHPMLDRGLVTRKQVINVITCRNGRSLRQSVLNVMDPQEFRDFELFTDRKGSGLTMREFRTELFDMFYSQREHRSRSFVQALAKSADYLAYARAHGLEDNEVRPRFWSKDYLVGEPKKFLNLDRDDLVLLISSNYRRSFRESVLNVMMPAQFLSFKLFSTSPDSLSYTDFTTELFDMFYSQPEYRSSDFVDFLCGHLECFGHAIAQGLQGREISPQNWIRASSYFYEGEYEDDITQYVRLLSQANVRLLSQANVPLPLGQEQEVLLNLIGCPQAFQLARALAPEVPLTNLGHQPMLARAANLDYLLEAGVSKNAIANIDELLMTIISEARVLLFWWLANDIGIPANPSKRFSIDVCDLGEDLTRQLVEYIFSKGRADLVKIEDIVYSPYLLDLALQRGYYSPKDYQIILDNCQPGCCRERIILMALNPETPPVKSAKRL